MQRFLNKTKSKFSLDRPQQASPADLETHQQQAPNNATEEPQKTVVPPTLQDVTRYRYHHGCNIGSIFVLERWLTPHMFPPNSPIGSSELAAALYWVNHLSLEVARDRYRNHWMEFTTDAEMDWLRDTGRVTTVRLPIGYWTLGSEYCKGTAFERVGPLYDERSWWFVRGFVNRLKQRGIGTLIDVHGLPGGANGNDHSGTNSGKAEFWSSKKNKQLAAKVMCFIAEEAKTMDGVAGLQIVNEAEWGAKGMFEWYDEVLKAVGKVDPTLPIYISDAWALDTASSWSKIQNQVRDGSTRNPVVVDTHLYWCFEEKDRHKSPREISDEVLTKLSELDTREGSVHAGGAAQVIVGEYSCVLADEAWQKGNGQTKEELVALFGRTQSGRYQERAGGAFFWNYKMDWMPGGEWGFKQMVEQGAIARPHHLALSSEDVIKLVDIAQTQRDGRRERDFGRHCSWWDTNHAGNYEHWRFENGWTLGWDDAVAFFCMRNNTSGTQGGDKIGMLDLWTLKRLRESDYQRGNFVWEWEHGFRQGVRAFYEAAGISGNLQAYQLAPDVSCSRLL